MNKIKTARRERNKLDKIWRTLCLSRDNNQCVMCGKAEHLNVHHILQKELYPEFRQEVWNGITLCVGHHKFSRRSAHRDSLNFFEWLRTKQEQRFKYIHEHITVDEFAMTANTNTDNGKEK